MSKRKKQALAWCISAGFSLAVMIGCFTAAWFITEKTYREYSTVSASSSREIRLNSYKKAIGLLPGRANAWLLILDVYAEDGLFQQEESDEFLALYNALHGKLPNSAAAADVYAMAGLLYVNGYDANATIRLRMALPFFELALPLTSQESENFAAVSCYAGIGKYYRDYIWTTTSKEIPAADVKQMINGILETWDVLLKNEGGDRIYNLLGFADAACNLLYSQRDVLAATTEKECVTALLDRIYAALPDPKKLQIEKNKDMAESLLTNREMYYDMIERAFDKKGGES